MSTRNMTCFANLIIMCNIKNGLFHHTLYTIQGFYMNYFIYFIFFPIGGDMDPIKSIWKSFISESQRPPEKDTKVVVVDTIIHELEYHIKELERIVHDKEIDDRRRNTGVDYSWLISTAPKGFEIPQLQRLELEELCYKIKPEECSRILSLFRDSLFNDPLPSHLPRIMRSCIIQVIEQRPKEETLTEWVSKRTLSLTRIRPNPKVSPSQLGDPEVPSHEETRRCYSTPALQSTTAPEFCHQGIDSLPV